MENPKWSLANVLVVGGVAIEAVCTFLLFGFDEGISNKQQSTIEQLLSRRVLTAEQKSRIASALSLYLPGDFITVTIADDEAWGFVMQIAEALKAAGWKWRACGEVGLGILQPLDGRPASCMSILDHIEIQSPSDLDKPASGLADAIRDRAIIGMDKVSLIPNPKLNNRLIIIVGSKR